MIVNKKMLQIKNVAEVDKKTSEILGNVVIRNDGTIIASNTKSRVCMSPIPDNIKKMTGFEESELILEELSVPVSSITSFLACLKSDNLLGGILECCEIIESKNGCKCVIKDTNGTENILQGLKYDKKYLDWNKVFKDIKNGKNNVKVVFNLKRLIVLLQTIDKMVNDNEFSPVFLEVNPDKQSMIIKVIDQKTGQIILACNTGYEIDSFPEDTAWELKIYK
jgi:hypothetical protein